MFSGFSAVAVHNDLDATTEGALYALQYEATANGWDPHVWAYRREDGQARFIFYATDREGRTKYFDYESGKDTGDLTERVLFFERMLECGRALSDAMGTLTRPPEPQPTGVARYKLD